MIQLNYASGPIKICSIFDFVPEVKREMVRSQYERIAVQAKTAFENSNRYNPYAPDPLTISKSMHTLQLNPMKLITELKKTTTKLSRERHITVSELIEELSYLSMNEMGVPTHMFSIGTDKYALVGKEDVVLFVTEDSRMQLVCTKPNRNFVVYAPNLEFKV